MENLKLHSGGKRIHLKELRIEYKRKIEEVKKKFELSAQDKAQVISDLKSELRTLNDQADYNLY